MFITLVPKLQLGNALEGSRRFYKGRAEIGDSGVPKLELGNQ